MKSFKLILAVSAVLGLSVATSANALGPAAQKTTSGYVCTNDATGTLTLRSGPGQQFKRITSITNNTPVTVYKEVVGNDNKSWYNVTVGRYNGWVRYDYVCGL
ncbi:MULTISPECIES: SH3 domain-containing protein [unclassified Acinetobacter]|uniref:SH3 domain-containing protein n=1 Tax=unclassified Acinetobacter TaxID=196816 RepID=UPI0035B9AB12